MELGSFKKLVAVSALALGVTAYASGAWAIQSGDPNPIGVTATVENTIVVVTSDIGFGQIGAMSDAVDTATASVSTAGVFTGDSSPQAAIVNDPTSASVAGTINVTAFQNTQLFTDYSNVVDMTEVGGHTFIITDLLDNADAPTTGVAGVAGSWNNITGNSPGSVTTNGAGVMELAIGASIITDPLTVPAAYNDGVYTGSFDLTVSY